MQVGVCAGAAVEHHLCQAELVWISFGPDVLVAIIGAVLTVVIAFFTYLFRTWQRENQALRGLIRELHSRRAIAQDANPRVHLMAKKRPDYNWVIQSVISMRDLIRHTSNLVGYASDLQLVLSDMAQDCNSFLEKVERRPRHYDFYAAHLRSRLAMGVHSLSQSRRSIAFLHPGDGAINEKAFLRDV